MARILIVDDERDLATMLQFLLEKDGHSVTAASDGREALAVLGIDPPDGGRELPDLALVDLMMPQVDGLELSARMHADPRAKSVKVLMLTGKGAAVKGTPNIAALVDKPFDPKDLRALIARVLAGKA